MSSHKSSQKSAFLKGDIIRATQTLDVKSRLLLASIPLFSLLLFAPDYLIGSLPSWDVTMVLILLAGGTSLILFCALNPEQRWKERLTPHSALRGLAVFIFLYGTVLIYVSLQQYWNFGSFGRDTSIPAQALWYTIREGKVSYTSLEGYHLGHHASPTLIFLVPFFAIYPHAATLLVLRVLFLAFSAIPLYKLLERNLRPAEAKVLSCVYLLYTPVLSQNILDSYELQFFPLLILWALYFFECKRFWPFLGLFLSAMLIREELALLGPAFAFYGWTRSRQLRWTLTPLMAGILWAVIAFKFIIPYFSPVGYRHSQFTTQALQQLTISKFISIENIRYLAKIHQPIGYIMPYLSGMWIFAAPFIGGILVTTKMAAKSLYSHFQLLVAPFLFLSASLGISSLTRRLQSRMKPAMLHGLPLALAASIALLCVGQSYQTFFKRLDFHFTPFSIKYPNDTASISNATLPSGYIQTLDKVVSILPPDASLVVPSYLTPHLAARPYIRDWLDKEGLDNADYIVLDRNARNWYTRKVLNDPAKRLGLVNFERVFNENGVEVYRSKKLAQPQPYNLRAKL